MSMQYDGSHAITFIAYKNGLSITKNTWTNFAMIPSNRVNAAPQSVSYQMVTIPNTSKRIDITDSMPTGKTYGARNGSWNFIIDHNKWRSWSEAYYSILDFFHGKSFDLYFDDVPSVIYTARITVSEYNVSNQYSTVTLQYWIISGGD